MLNFESGDYSNPAGKAIFYWDIACNKGKELCPLYLNKKRKLFYKPSFSVFLSQWYDGKKKQDKIKAYNLENKVHPGNFPIFEFTYFLPKSKEHLWNIIENTKNRWGDVDIIFAGILKNCACNNLEKYIKRPFWEYGNLYFRSRQASLKIESILKEMEERKSTIKMMNDMDKINALDYLTSRLFFDDLNFIEKEDIETKIKDILLSLPEKYYKQGFIESIKMDGIKSNNIKRLDALSLYIKMYSAVYRQDFNEAAKCKKELDCVLKRLIKV